MNTIDYRNWGKGWVPPGHYVSFERDSVKYYEYAVLTDFAHWEYDWPETITTETRSGPFVPADLEITRGYRPRLHRNRIWQVIFGIKGQVEVYVEAPTDVHRHGIPKDPKPGSANWFTSHFEEYMSPFYEPTFLTEHWMMRPDVIQLAFDAYNPDAISDADLLLNLMINKIETERVGTIQMTETGISMIPTSQTRWGETLKKLWQGQIPCRPITLLGVRSPAEAPSGE